jgi:hypothetical protein
MSTLQALESLQLAISACARYNLRLLKLQLLSAKFQILIIENKGL